MLSKLDTAKLFYYHKIPDNLEQLINPPETFFSLHDSYSIPLKPIQVDLFEQL